jgi:hypothetical protein
MRNAGTIVALLLFPALLAVQCSSVCSSGGYGPSEGASGIAQYVVCMPQPSSCYNGDMILQILSVTLFEKTPISQALQPPDFRDDLLDSANQLNLFDL